MPTFIILAHYLEAEAMPVTIADTPEQAEKLAFEHFQGQTPTTDLCPAYYAIYTRDAKGYFSTLVKEIDV